MPRPLEQELETAAKERCDGFHPKVPLDLTKNNRISCRLLLVAGGVRDDFLPDSEERHERARDCEMSTQVSC